MKEEWKDIEGFKGHYQVSNKGRVRSWKNNRHGIGKKSKIIKGFDNGYGYTLVDLRLKNKRKTKTIHRLVLETFLPNNKLPCVNHIDGNKTNNSIENLEWCTYSQNERHAHDIGIGGSILKLSDVINIKKELQLNSNYGVGVRLSKKYGVSQSTISSIRHSRNWGRIDG